LRRESDVVKPANPHERSFDARRQMKTAKHNSMHPVSALPFLQRLGDNTVTILYLERDIAMAEQDHTY